MDVKSIVKRVSYSTNVANVDLQRIVAEIVKGVKYELLDGNDIEVKGFGVFRVVEKPEHEVTDRNTGEPFTMPYHKAVRFYPTKELNFMTGGCGDDKHNAP